MQQGYEWHRHKAAGVMGMDLKTAFQRAPEYLRLLIVMRAIALVVIALTVYCLASILEIPIPVVPLVVVIDLYAALAVATVLRLGHTAPVTRLEMFMQLLLDVAFLNAVLYFSGGAGNPLALYYFVLVLYSSTALPPRLVWALAAACLVSYAVLNSVHVELPQRLSADVNQTLDYITRALMYGFIAALIVWFGVRLTALQRDQHERLRAEAEKDARERYLLGLATLSAGTAHELSTPLSTISVVVNELRGSESPPEDWKESIDTLWTQVQLCRRSLSAMAGTAGVERLGEVRSVRATELLADVAASLRALRPKVALRLVVHIDHDLYLRTDHTLPQALMNFLNNAADASPGAVEMHAAQDRLNSSKLVIEVLDRGPGIAPELRERLGKSPIRSSKAPGSGHGAGMLIAHAAIERFGGSVAISPRRSGGTCVRIELPGIRLNTEREEADSGRKRIASR
jgi:two-component system sensor histidine kinase RegB